MTIPCLIVVTLFSLCMGAPVLAGQAASPLELVQKIPLENVQGRIDHMEADLAGKRLFVAALGNNTVEVLDTQTGRLIWSLSGFDEPQGVLFVPEFNKLFVANGGTGRCDILDGSSFQRLESVSFSGDADNMRYDGTNKIVYVGYGSGALGLIDARTGNKIGDIALEGHPESFQIEKASHRIFVNIPGGRIAVIDQEKRTVTATWDAGLLRKGNYPMALDETHHRLFVGYRWPSKVVVFDTESGKVVSEMENVSDADDIFYDPVNQRIYVSGGEGFLDVMKQADADHYETIAKIATARGARTSLFVPEWNRLYLAVPRQRENSAALEVFRTNP